MFSDAGTLPLILYSHDQLLEKVAELKENALFVEKISVEKGPAPKRQRRKGDSQEEAAAGPSSSSSEPEAPRPSDPKHSEEPVNFQETATTAASPLKGVVDVHCEMYGLPTMAFLHELLVYLHTSYGLQLRPVSTNFFSFAYYFTLL